MAWYSLLLGIAAIGLFERLARWEQENPRVWALAAGVCYFLPALTVGTLWAILGIVALSVAFVVRVVLREPPRGEGPRW